MSARDRWPAAGGLPEAYRAGQGIVVVVCGSGVVVGTGTATGGGGSRRRKCSEENSIDETSLGRALHSCGRMRLLRCSPRRALDHILIALCDSHLSDSSLR